MVDEVATTALVYDARGAQQGAALFAASGEKIIASNQGVMASQQAVGASAAKMADGFAAPTARVAAETAKQARSFDTLARRIDPLGQAVRDAERDMERLSLAAAGTGQSAERAAGLMSAAQARVTAAQKAQSSSAMEVTRQTGAASNMMRQFGIQSFDVFSSLSAGAPVMTVFIQQGAQIAQVAAAQGGALAALGQVARSAFSAMVSPIGLAVAGLATLGAGIAIVTARTMAVSDETRDMAVAISAVGRSAELSAGQIQKYVSVLNQQGVGRSDAAGIIAQLARNPALSGADIGRVAAVVPDAAVALGVDAAAAAKDVGAAAAGSLAAITKLDDALNFLTRDQRTQIRTMLEHGDQIGATGIAMDAFGKHVDGTRERSLGPFGRALDEITNAYNRAIDAAARANFDIPLAVLSPLGALAKSALSNPTAAPTARQAEDASLAAGTKERERQGKVVDELTKKLDEENRVISAGLPGRAAVRAAIEAGRIAAEKGLGVDEKRALTTAMVANANRQAADGAIQEASATGRQIAAAVMLTGATLEGRSAAILAAAAAEAHDKAATQAGVSENAWAKAIANRQAAQGAQKVAEAAAALGEQEAGLQRLIDAQGAEGRQAAELANKIADATRELDALEAVTTRVDVLEAIMKARDAIELRLRAQDRLNIALRERNALETGQFQIEAVQKEISLVGQAADVREREIAAFRTLQELRRTDKADINNLTEAQKALIEQSRQYADLQGSLRHQQNSLTAVTDTLGTAFDRLGQAMVDAFVSGQGRAVNFGNVMRGIVSSLVTDFAKLAVINPILNAVVLSTSGLRPTLAGAFGGGGVASGGGGSSLLGQASNLSSLAGLSDALGITSIKDTLLGWGNSLGITGNGGLLGGLNSLLSTTVFTGPTGSLAASAGAEFGIGAAASAGAPVSLGSLLGGAGAGFAIGSIGGGLLQNSMGKTGPAPTIGAGVGAVGGALIGSIFGPAGALLGGILGGTVGGGAGGLIGPKKASSFSSTGLGISATGGLDIGKTVSQIADTTAELAQLQQQVGQINQLLAASGAVITSLGGVSQIGQNTPGGFQDPSKAAGIDDAFSGLRFSAPGNDTLNRAISGRSFGAVADLQGVIQEVTTFVDQVVPALKKLGQPNQFGIGAIASGLDEIKTQFDAAIATAQRLGYAESDLVAAREQALTVATANAQQVLNGIDSGLSQRLLAATAAVTGKSTDALTAAMSAFDAAAAGQRKQFDAELLTLLGDQAKTHESYTSRMAALETALGEERLAIVKSYNDKIAETQMGIQRGIEERVFRLSGNTASAQLHLLGINAATEIETLRKSLTDLGSTSEHIANTISVLTAVQEAERRAFLDNLGAQWQDMRTGLLSREAAVANDNTPLQLQLFDAKATAEVDALRRQIIALGASGSAVTDTLARLVAVQGLERQAIVDQAAAIERQRQEAAAGTASGVIRSITDYARGLQFGAESPLSATAQLDAANRQFDAVRGAAAAGDFASAQQLTGFAEVLRSAARNVFGSGVGYVDVIRRITDALEPISTMAPERLITSVMTTELRSQTTTLSADLMELRSVLIQVRDSIRAGSGAPPASRAA